VPERQALDIVLRGVSGYMLAARDAGGTGASMYDRIMILPTSAAPRNPPPAAAVPVFQGAPGGIVRPIVPRQAEGQDANDDDVAPINPVIDGVPLGRPGAIPRPVGMPVASPVFIPPVTINPDDDQPQLPSQPPAGVVPTPANPFGLPAGSSARPGMITPVPPTPPQGGPRTPPEN
jgi:hypothetical protein